MPLLLLIPLSYTIILSIMFSITPSSL
jgi:hypothetical protein